MTNISAHTSNKGACHLIGRVMEAAVTFFLAAVLIYLGVMLLAKIWWAILLLSVGFIAMIIGFRLWRFTKRWE